MFGVIKLFFQGLWNSDGDGGGRKDFIGVGRKGNPHGKGA